MKKVIPVALTLMTISLASCGIPILKNVEQKIESTKETRSEESQKGKISKIGPEKQELLKRINGGWESIAKRGSYFVFEEDGTSYWYRSSKDLKDNYFKCDTKVLNGSEAIEDLGLTYEGVLKMISNSKGKVGIDNIYSITMTPNYLISDKVDKTAELTAENTIKLLFIYVDENQAQAHNYGTGDTYFLQRRDVK